MSPPSNKPSLLPRATCYCKLLGNVLAVEIKEFVLKPVVKPGELKTNLTKFEAALFVLRKRAANLAAQQPGLPFYVSQLQCVD